MKTFLIKNSKHLLSFAFTVTLFSSCDPCNDSDRYEELTDARLDFELIDAKTSKTLFSNPAYVADSLRLLNTNLKIRKFASENQRYSFSIDSIYKSSQNKIGTRVDKTFYLYLNKSDTDTIRLTFLPTRGKCDLYFTDYQVFYNKRIITNSRNTVSFFALIYKM